MKRAELLHLGGGALRFLLYNTHCSVTLPEGGRESDWILREALAAAQDVQSLLDAYDRDSALSRLNLAAKAGGAAQASPELCALLQTALTAGKAGRGAFDITTGALSRLWSFTAASPRAPSSAKIAQALAATGSQWVCVDSARGRVSFARPGMRLDFGAAGKGYAADRIGGRLVECGVTRAAVNLGGNLLLIGSGPEAGLWRIGIQAPWSPRGAAAGILRTAAGAVSTSGGYDRYFVQDGKLCHHLLDPSSGCPSEADLLGCTVVCQSALHADILSTTLFVGGPEAMRRTAGALNAGNCGYVIIRPDGTPEVSEQLQGLWSAC